MDYYDDPSSCVPVPEPAPVVSCEPAPLPPIEPPAYAPPAPEIFPDLPAAPVADVPAAPAVTVTAVTEAPLPAAVPESYYQPVANAPLDPGTLLGPSTVGGSADTGAYIGGTPDLSSSAYIGGTPDLSSSAYIGGTPDLSSSTYVGGTTPDLGGTWLEYNGMPVARFEIPVTPGPFNAVAQNILDAHNAAMVNIGLGGNASAASPAPWTPGFDSDRDGVLNERDSNPRDRFEF